MIGEADVADLRVVLRSVWNERLEEAHLDPLVVADAAGGLDDAEEPGQLAPVPGRKGGTGLARFGHALIPRSSRT